MGCRSPEVNKTFVPVVTLLFPPHSAYLIFSLRLHCRCRHCIDLAFVQRHTANCQLDPTAASAYLLTPLPSTSFLPFYAAESVFFLQRAFGVWPYFMPRITRTVLSQFSKLKEEFLGQKISDERVVELAMSELMWLGGHFIDRHVVDLGEKMTLGKYFFA